MTEGAWAVFSTGWLAAIVTLVVALLQGRRNGHSPQRSWNGKERRKSGDCIVDCPRGIDTRLESIEGQIGELTKRVDMIYKMLAEGRK